MVVYKVQTTTINMEKLVILMLSILAGVCQAQECEVDLVCFRGILDQIQSRTGDYALCEADAALAMTVEIAACSHDGNLCTEDKRIAIESERMKTQDVLDNICANLPVTTTPRPTEAPIPCGTTEGWEDANRHIAVCTKRYGSLDDFKYATKLNKFGVCSATQSLLDCAYERSALNSCPQFTEGFNRQLVPYILFGHMFDCTELTLNGKSIKSYDTTRVCNIWEWMACHNVLFDVLAGINTIIPTEPDVRNTDLNQFENFDVTAVIQGLIGGQSTKHHCNTYANVDWNYIHQCRASMEDSCALLDVPRRDSLWFNVIDLVYELKDSIHDKISVLMNIEDICGGTCDDIPTRTNKIANECKANAGTELPQDIINKFNAEQNTQTECSKMVTFRDCVKTLVGNCNYMEKVAVLNLHYDNLWITALSICQLDAEITPDGRCHAEDFSANKILSEYSFQHGPRNLLEPTYTEPNFCYFLQEATDGYAMHIAKCPALQARYWSAELPLMNAANQMLPSCDVKYQTYGNTKLMAIEKSRCDMNNWVSCMGPLWTALDVSSPGGVLDLAGFKALLGLVWKYGDSAVQGARCQQVKDLDFEAMEQCVSGLNMDCQFPKLALPDEQSHEMQLRNPFDVTVIKTFVRESCSSGCQSNDVGANVVNCLNYDNDLTVVATYPIDIIISAFTGDTDLDKCDTIVTIKDCLDYQLNPDTCALYSSGLFVNSMDYREALIVCSDPPKRNTGRNNEDTTTGAAAASLSILSVLAVVIGYVM